MASEHDPRADPDARAPAGSASWRSRNVLVLGLVSLLTDASSEMVVPLLPAFLTGVLGAGAFALGWIEGLADAAASVLKFFSGRWADRTGRHRPLVVGGYTLSSSVRPLVALAGSAWQVLAVRLADRTGKGIRTSPRDALIARSVAPAQRGAAFGLHRGMDHVGAVIGPVVAALFLMFVSQDLRALFWLSAAPGAAAVVVAWLGVKETANRKDSPAPAPETARAVGRDPRLLGFLLPLAVFTLGNASDVFLLLKAGGTRTPLATLPLLWMTLHVVKAVSSVPGGRLADRWGRRRTVGSGWLVYAGIYAGFAFASTQAAVWALFVSYGLYHGLTEGPERALIADVAPRLRQGAAFGWFHLTQGILALAASVLFGGLWSLAGSRTAFLASASLALAAVALLALTSGLARPAGASAGEGG